MLLWDVGNLDLLISTVLEVAEGIVLVMVVWVQDQPISPYHVQPLDTLQCELFILSLFGEALDKLFLVDESEIESLGVRVLVVHF